MAKKNCYTVCASKEDSILNYISFQKDDSNGMIEICLEGEKLKFTVKEAKEIAEKLKKCANE